MMRYLDSASHGEIRRSNFILVMQKKKTLERYLTALRLDRDDVLSVGSQLPTISRHLLGLSLAVSCNAGWRH